MIYWPTIPQGHHTGGDGEKVEGLAKSFHGLVERAGVLAVGPIMGGFRDGAKDEPVLERLGDGDDMLQGPVLIVQDKIPTKRLPPRRNFLVIGVVLLGIPDQDGRQGHLSFRFLEK